MGDHVSIVREAKMPLGLLARVGLTRTCPEAGGWTGRAQDALPDSQGSALCRAPGAPGPRASAGNASKRRNPDRVRGGRSNRKPREQQGPWGRTPPPPRRGVGVSPTPSAALPPEGCVPGSRSASPLLGHPSSARLPLRSGTQVRRAAGPGWRHATPVLSVPGPGRPGRAAGSRGSLPG